MDIQKAIMVNEKDNVAVALREIKTGEKVMLKVGSKDMKVEVKSDIRFLHKLALKDIKRGEKVIKYGHNIGEAKSDILAGEHVHIHNLRSLRGST